MYIKKNILLGLKYLKKALFEVENDETMKKDKLLLEISTLNFNPAQIRALKSLIHALEKIQGKSEQEVFEGSSETFRLLAFLISETRFSHQALEYGLDNLNELVLNSRIFHLDN